MRDETVDSAILQMNSSCFPISTLIIWWVWQTQFISQSEPRGHGSLILRLLRLRIYNTTNVGCGSVILLWFRHIAFWRSCALAERQMCICNNVDPQIHYKMIYFPSKRYTVNASTYIWQSSVSTDVRYLVKTRFGTCITDHQPPSLLMCFWEH